MPIRIFPLFAATVLALRLLAPAVEAQITVDTFSIPTPESAPSDIASGPEGNLWFVESATDRIGRITPSGAVTELAFETGAAPQQVVAGVDGRVWVTLPGLDAIGAIEARDQGIGPLTTYDLGTEGGAAFGVARGPAGALWYTEAQFNSIGWIEPGGEQAGYHLDADAVRGMIAIARGPDDAMWFTAIAEPARVGRIDVLGDFSEFPLPTPDSVPGSLAAGADGNLWVTLTEAPRLTRVTPAGATTDFTLGFDDMATLAIEPGPDDGLWISQVLEGTGAAAIVRLDPVALSFTRYVLPAGHLAFGLAFDREGDLWFTDPENDRIGRLNLGLPVPPTSPDDLVATATSPTTVRLTWRDTSAVEDDFAIRRRNTGGGTPIVATAPRDATSRVVSGLQPGTTHTFWVEARNDRGSAFSLDVEATTPPEGGGGGGGGGACSPSESEMCLGGGRFRVSVDWRDGSGNAGDAQVVPAATDDSGLFWFFDPNNWEMLVKVLDGCGLNDRFWVFSAATTNVEYTLRVTDTETGSVAEYFNPLGTAAAALTDTEALHVCSARAAPVEPRRVDLADVPEGVAEVGRRRGDSGDGRPRDGDCVAGETSMCLGGDRFRVRVDWRDFSGNTGQASVVPVGSNDSGLFWFFGPDNWEMLVKILDGCALTNHYWVFSAATTNVEYTLRVTDTETGSVAEYFNPLGTAAAALTDTEALAVCD